MDHMEFSIALPPYVEFTSAGVEWADMKHRLSAHGKYSSDSRHQHEGLVKAFLINIAVEPVQEVFSMFGLSYDEALKFSRILQHLEDVCLPRFLIIYNRYKFFTCRQTFSDKFDYFLRDLLSWSKNCEFGDLKDILLKDCIITGIPDNSIRQRLLETEELDFTKTIEICRAVERRQRVKNAMVNTHQTIFTDASVDTENIFTVESEQIQDSVKEFCDASTNTVQNDFTIGITEEFPTDDIGITEEFYPDGVKDVMRPVMRNINVESEDIVSFSEPLKLSDNIQNCGIDRPCLNSKAADITERQDNHLRVLRRSERHKNHVEGYWKSGPKISRSRSHTNEIKNNSGKKLTGVKTDHGPNKIVDCKDQVESGSDSKLNMSKTNAGINKIAVNREEVESSSGKKLKLLKTEPTISSTQDHEGMDNSIGKALKLSFKTLVQKRRSGFHKEYTTVGQEGLVCTLCSQSFPDKLSVLSHLRKTHGKKHIRRLSLKCRVCKAVFTDLATLKKHRLVHKNEKKFKCDFCPTTFANPSHLKVHVRLHTGERPFTCDTCGASYPEASKLKAHMRKHTGEKPYHCSVCSRTFAWTAAYTRHMRIHTGERPYTCEFCGVNFADFTSLQRHIRTHTLEKPYQCDKCSAKFTDPSALKLHARIHNGERPYVCGTCGASFIRSQHLKEHTKLHTGEKPFRCETCGAKFAEASKLKSHCRKHTGEKPYLCKICGTRFAWTAAFTRHMRTHTMEKPYVCDFCGSHYADHSTLTRHRRTHTGERPYPCKICGTDFADNSSLHRHTRIHTGEKSYTCEVCGSSFAVKSYLVRHTRTHTGEKPYGCDLCGSKFTDSSKLNRHRKIHFKSQTKQEKSETRQPQQQYEELQPVQHFPQDGQIHQPLENERQDLQTDDQQQQLISVVHNLQHPILITATLLPLNNTLPFTSSVYT